MTTMANEVQMVAPKDRFYKSPGFIVGMTLFGLLFLSYTYCVASGMSTEAILRGLLK
jgi:hypothetical protein